jgi:bacteriophage exclusion system BrxC/D-like protein
MLVQFGIGQRVLHGEYGDGVVKGATANGAFLRVLFSAIGAEERVIASALRARGVAPASVESTATPAPPALPPSAPTSEAALDGRRLAVECLRQGLPPPGKLASWTFGHVNARRKLDAALRRAAEGEGSVLLVRAGYGNGKSHFGRLGRDLAHEHGFVTMQVDLDGEGLSLSTGTRAFSALFASAALPPAGDGSADHLVPGLGTLLKLAGPRAPKRLPQALEELEPFLGIADRWIESEGACEVLERYLSGEVGKLEAVARIREVLGVRIELTSLDLNYGTTDRRQQARAQQVARVTRLGMLAGAKGGFVVLDELDHDLAGHDANVGLQLRHLAKIALRNPIVLVLLARETNGLDIDGAEAVELDALEEEELARLVDKTVETYMGVHASPVLTRGRAELLQALQRRYAESFEADGWGPRFFVRSAIEACEATRLLRLDSLAAALT